MLCETWDDDRLDCGRGFLTTDHDFAQNGRPSLPQSDRWRFGDSSG